jgi:hypothetical protein
MPLALQGMAALERVYALYDAKMISQMVNLYMQMANALKVKLHSMRLALFILMVMRPCMILI